MNHKERSLRIILVFLALAILAVPAIYANVTGNYFSELGSNLIVSVSDLLLIGALLIGMKNNPKAKAARIGAISGLTVLLFLRWS